MYNYYDGTETRFYMGYPKLEADIAVPRFGGSSHPHAAGGEWREVASMSGAGGELTPGSSNTPG
jgi:hypothetical protein